MDKIKKHGLNYLFGLLALITSTFLVLHATEQFIMPIIFVLLFSMTYFLFVEFKQHEMIGYKTAAMLLVISFGYICFFLNSEHSVLYFATYLVPLIFLFSLNNIIFYTGILVNSIIQTLLIISSIYFDLGVTYTVLAENTSLNAAGFFSLQVFFVFLYLKIKRTTQELKVHENSLLTETTTLETALHNVYFSNQKTSEIAYHFHQYVHNLEKTKNHFQTFLENVKKETTKSNKNESDTNFLLDKALDSLENLKEELEKEQQKVQSYQKSASLNLSLSNDEIKTIQNVEEINENNRENLNTLIDSTSTIYSLAELIRGISNQINLLSLNAAIEASKAGEAGKGFSVIAKEIKHLQLDVLNTLSEIKNEIDTIEKAFNHIKEGNRQIDNKTEQLLIWKRDNMLLHESMNSFIKDYLTSNELSNQKLSVATADINQSLLKIHDLIESTKTVENEIEESFILTNQQRKLTNELKELLGSLQRELTKITEPKSRKTK